MKPISIFVLLILCLLTINTTAQESTFNNGNTANAIQLNCAFGMGTFAAGENVGG